MRGTSTKGEIKGVIDFLLPYYNCVNIGTTPGALWIKGQWELESE